MITSKDLLDQTGISRATLNNYISLGLIPRPEVKRISPAPGEALTTLGYFPDWSLSRVQEIRALKREGLSMDRICEQLTSNTGAMSKADILSTPKVHEKRHRDTADEVPHAPPTSNLSNHADHNNAISDDLFASPEKQNSDKIDINHNINDNNASNLSSDIPSIKTSRDGTLNVSIDKIPYPAYMMNYDCGLIWLNEAAKSSFFASSNIPERAEDRFILPTLLEWANELTESNKSKLMASHFSVIKHRLTKESLAKNTAGMSSSVGAWLENCYATTQAPENNLVNETNFHHPNTGNQRLISISFREGILFTYVPEKADANQLLEWLSQRDSVIRTLLSQRLPVLTNMVGMVADLQNSVRICSELPPEEYFQLINEIWTTLDPIFRKHYGAYGKHTGDGMVYYFFPQPDSNYLMNAIQCACEVREIMKKISNAWALKKEWTNQLYMNIGLSEGEEWLGTFKTNTSYELVVLGETMNICGRLSDFARFGKVWATKNLISKLSPSDREMIEYGVTRTGLEQDVFVANSYAQISSLLNKDDPKSLKLMEISSLAVTEIRSIK